MAASLLPRLLVPVAAILLVGGSVSAGLRLWGPSPHGEEHSILVDGVERDYLLFVPPGLPEGQVPLFIVLHGAYSWGEQTARQTGLSALAREQGFIVAYPEGDSVVPRLRQFWNAGHCCYKAAVDGVDDMGFLEALHHHLLATQPVDPTQVYLVGFSNGAMLAHWYAATHSHEVAGLAAIAGTIGTLDEDGGVAWRIPSPGRALPVFIGHGVHDKGVPYEGGPGRNSERWRPISVDDSVACWRAAAGLAGDPRVTAWPEGAAELAVWESGHGPAVARLKVDAGHSWPGADHVPLFSKPRQDVDATALIWDFFMANGLQPPGVRQA